MALPPTQYKFTVRQVSGCTPAACPTCGGGTCAIYAFDANTTTGWFSGLAPGTTYSVTAFGFDAGGRPRCSDNMLQFTTAPRLTLTSAEATGPTTARATALAEPGDAFTKVCGGQAGLASWWGWHGGSSAACLAQCPRVRPQS